MRRDHDANAKIPDHENTIRQFLYEDGPQTSDQIAQHIGLSQARAVTILNLMKESGVVAIERLGSPPAPYWLLAEDA